MSASVASTSFATAFNSAVFGNCGQRLCQPRDRGKQDLERRGEFAADIAFLQGRNHRLRERKRASEYLQAPMSGLITRPPRQDFLSGVASNALAASASPAISAGRFILPSPLSLHRRTDYGLGLQR
nr:hypothetical protein [Bradyrhizobium sp. 137]